MTSNLFIVEFRMGRTQPLYHCEHSVRSEMNEIIRRVDRCRHLRPGYRPRVDWVLLAHVVRQRGRRVLIGRATASTERTNTYMERAIRLGKDAADISNDDFPVILTSGEIATIWRDGDRLYHNVTVLDFRVNANERRWVKEEDGTRCKGHGSYELSVGG